MVNYKKCPDCGEIKNADSFHKNKASRDGLVSYCKLCLKKRKKEYYKNSKEKICEKAKEYYRKNIQKTREYKKQNKDKINERRRIFSKEKKRKNPEYKMAVTLSIKINKILKRVKLKKLEPSEKLTGCTWAFLRQHLESQFQPGMTWENHGTYYHGKPMTWHVDHVKPISSFDLTNEDHQKQCFHWTNLRPMWAIDNILKGSKIE